MVGALPATMGDGRIVYRVTTSNGEFDVVQPWLTMGTIRLNSMVV